MERVKYCWVHIWCDSLWGASSVQLKKITHGGHGPRLTSKWVGKNTKNGYNGLRDKTCFDLNHLEVFPINLWHSNLASMLLLMECKFLPQEKGAQIERATCSQQPVWYKLIDFFIMNHFPNKCLQTSQELRMLSKCQGHYLIVNRFSPLSWFKFRNLSVIVNCVIKPLIH